VTVARRAPLLRAAIPAALLLAAGAALAYNDDPGADRVFPAFHGPRTSEEVPAGTFAPTHVVYEVRRASHHEAEIHFRDISDRPWAFDFWFPGWQEPGDNPRVALEPFLRTREETVIRIPLRHGRPGMAWSTMVVYDLRGGAEDRGPALSPSREAPAPPVPDGSWMPVLPLVEDQVVLRSSLLARLAPREGGVLAEFLNPSRRDLHFAFAVPGLGVAAGATPRVTVPSGGAASIPVPGGPASLPLPLLRVVVRDLRAGKDAGFLHATDPDADVGWFPLETADGSSPLPKGLVLARLAPAGAGKAAVRFRSRMAGPVRLRFAIPGYQVDSRENPSVTLAPGEEIEVLADLDRPADGRMAFTRLRAFEVSHHED
jgi:hypothetical protein